MSENTDKINHKQFIFCLEYIKDYNATQAYIRAGYSEDGAQPSSSKLLLNPIIKATICELEHDRLEAAKVTGESILKRLNHIADKADKAGDLPVATRALEILGRNKLWDKGSGIKNISSNPDGTMKISFDGDDETDKPADK